MWTSKERIKPKASAAQAPARSRSQESLPERGTEQVSLQSESVSN